MDQVRSNAEWPEKEEFQNGWTEMSQNLCSTVISQKQS